MNEKSDWDVVEEHLDNIFLKEEINGITYIPKHNVKVFYRAEHSRIMKEKMEKITELFKNRQSWEDAITLDDVLEVIKSKM